MPRRDDDEYAIVEPQYSYSWTLTGGRDHPQGGRGSFFSSTELKHIALAVLVLTAALTLVLWDRSYDTLSTTATLAAIAVLLGFFGHEMAHKLVARRYGCWAEFRADMRGLGIAVLISFFGFLFAAPGAVYILGNISKGENAKISLAGPAVNIAVAGACVPFFLPDVVSIGGGLEFFAASLCFFNGILALFNLIPIPPFDGSKIWRWNLPAYIVVIVVAGLLFALAFYALSRLSL